MSQLRFDAGMAEAMEVYRSGDIRRRRRPVLLLGDASMNGVV
jgi:hypothetical protein